MNSNTMLKAAIAALLPTTAALCTSSAQAGGLALMEQNSSGLGNAYAGSAAVADDASTIFFNAAGLTQLKRPSLVVNVAAIRIQSDFHDSGSLAAVGQNLNGTGGNAGNTAVLPALYFAVPLTDKVSGGIGVNAPFGLKTEYDSDWMGRFQAIKSDVKTTNINTALAFKVNDVVSIGVGADFQTLDATLTKAVDYTAVVGQGVAAQLLPALQAGAITPGQYGAQVGNAMAFNAGLQGNSAVKGSDTAWGFDVGLLFNISDATKVGLSYRSAMKYNLTGNATITAPAATDPTGQAVIAGARATVLADGPINLNIKLPASANAAVSQKLSNAFELLLGVSWTQWSSIQELRILRPSGVTLSNTPESWDDTWRYAVGANWQVTDALKLRAGAAFDESPVPDATRTPRLPDNDRKWLSLGARVDVSKNVAVDMGYTHVFVKDASLDQSDGGLTPLGYPYGRLTGTQQTKIDILGVQATVSF